MAFAAGSSMFMPMLRTFYHRSSHLKPMTMIVTYASGARYPPAEKITEGTNPQTNKLSPESTTKFSRVENISTSLNVNERENQSVEMIINEGKINQSMGDHSNPNNNN